MGARGTPISDGGPAAGGTVTREHRRPADPVDTDPSDTDPSDTDRSDTDPSDTDLSDTVVVSNRGPRAFREEDGRLVAGPVGGGLAGSLHPLVAGTGAVWVATSLGDADRRAAAAGLMADDDLRVELVLPDPTVATMAYDVVSNASLWFCHHHLFDAARRPRNDARWDEAWDAYREVNRAFATAVADLAPEGGRVVAHDYHLTLMGADLRRLRPDLRTVHFTHTPFADPSVLRMLPRTAAAELLAGMAGYGACGFHTDRWAAAFRACATDPVLARPGTVVPPTFSAPLPVDADRLAREVADPAVGAALDELETLIGDPDRQVVVRVDRMELSKNLLRGFLAFEELLEHDPARRGRVVFLALTYPTRQGLAEYLGYQREVEATVERINDRWGSDDWTPIVLDVEDDFPRSLAAYTRYDALLVNPVRDGLNLVAKEGPLVNRRDGVVVLSREAGAFDELGDAVEEVNPFDVAETARALARALDLDADARAARAERLRTLMRANEPADWFSEVRAAAR